MQRKSLILLPCPFSLPPLTAFSLLSALKSCLPTLLMIHSKCISSNLFSLFVITCKILQNFIPILWFGHGKFVQCCLDENSLMCSGLDTTQVRTLQNLHLCCILGVVFLHKNFYLVLLVLSQFERDSSQVTPISQMWHLSLESLCTFIFVLSHSECNTLIPCCGSNTATTLSFPL